jgi:hypothetical protein
MSLCLCRQRKGRPRGSLGIAVNRFRFRKNDGTRTRRRLRAPERSPPGMTGTRVCSQADAGPRHQTVEIWCVLLTAVTRADIHDDASGLLAVRRARDHAHRASIPRQVVRSTAATPLASLDGADLAASGNVLAVGDEGVGTLANRPALEPPRPPVRPSRTCSFSRSGYGNGRKWRMPEKGHRT